MKKCLSDYLQRFGHVLKFTGLGVLGVQQFLTKNIIVLELPLYSLDLAS